MTENIHVFEDNIRLKKFHKHRDLRRPQDVMSVTCGRAPGVFEASFAWKSHSGVSRFSRHVSDKGYQWALDDASLQRAKKELNEDPGNREGAVDTLRKWVREQGWLKCPTGNQQGSGFIFQFLHVE